jgi:hypothetical protein
MRRLITTGLLLSSLKLAAVTEPLTPEGDPPVKCSLQAAVESIRDAGRLQPEATLSQRQSRQKSLAVGQFRVHYDTTGAHAAAFLDQFFRPIPGTADDFADSAASIANAVRTMETGTLGYLSPPSDGNAGGGPEYDIYILDLGAAYGSTFPETAVDNVPEGARYTSYIEIDNDFAFVNPPTNRGLPALRVTIAHEFHHAIQLGAYGLWQDHIYFYEITATWMEDVVFNEVDDYIQYLFSSQSQFFRPDISFSTSTLIMYSRAVWGHFIAKRFGPEALRTAWELSFQYHVSPLEGMDLALQTPEYSSDFGSAFSEWSVWNYFTGNRYDDAYYPEGVQYPLIAELSMEFAGTADTLEGSLPVLAARYHQITSSGPPLWLVAADLDVNGAVTGDPSQSNYSYFLHVGQPDPLYQETTAGFSVKPAVSDPFAWQTWVIVNGLVTELGLVLPSVTSGVPFPNPFSPEIHRTMNIPVGSEFPVEIELSIFSGDMALVYSARTVAVMEKGQRVVQWDGMTSRGDVAQSGIYFYATNGNGSLSKGKFALVRR